MKITYLSLVFENELQQFNIPLVIKKKITNKEGCEVKALYVDGKSFLKNIEKFYSEYKNKGITI